MTHTGLSIRSMLWHTLESVNGLCYDIGVSAELIVSPSIVTVTQAFDLTTLWYCVDGWNARWFVWSQRLNERNLPDLIAAGISPHQSTCAITYFEGFITYFEGFKPTRQLGSSSDTPILCIPTERTHSLSQRSFSYAAPTVWNTFPYEIMPSNIISSFKSLLKTDLFQQSCW